MVEHGTGIGRDRLRAWERRHGFPGPERNAKGERSYPQEQLQRPQRTRRLLDRGMRPGKLLPESSEQPNKTVGAVLDAVRSADDGQVEVLLRRQCEKRSTQRFALETAIPLLQSVRELCTSPHFSRGSRMLALGSCAWTPFWSESGSRSYRLSEEQVQVRENKLGPG